MTAVAPLESPLHHNEQQLQPPPPAESHRDSVAASAAMLRSLAQSRASLRRRQSQAAADGSRPQSANRVLLQARRDEERDFRCQFFTAIGLAVLGAALCVAGVGLAAYGLPTPDRLQRDYGELSASDRVNVEVRLMLYGRLGGLLLGAGIFFIIVLLVIGLDYKVYLDRLKPVENVVAEMNRRLYANIMQNLRKVASDDDTISLSTSHRSSDRRSSMAVALVGKSGGGGSSVALRMSRPSTASGHRRNSLANLIHTGGRRNSLPVKEQQRMQLSPTWKVNNGFDFSKESIDKLRDNGEGDGNEGGGSGGGISSLDDMFNRTTSPKSPFPMEGIAEEGSAVPAAASEQAAPTVNLATTATASITDETSANKAVSAPDGEGGSTMKVTRSSPTRPLTPLIDGAPEGSQKDRQQAQPNDDAAIPQKSDSKQQLARKESNISKTTNAAASRPPTAGVSRPPTAAASRPPTAAAGRPPTAAASRSPTAAAGRPPTAAASRPPTEAAGRPPTAGASKTPSQPSVAATATASRRPQTVASRQTPVALASTRQKTAATGSSRHQKPQLQQQQQQKQQQSMPQQTNRQQNRQSTALASRQSRPANTRASGQEQEQSIVRPETGFCRDYTMVFESDHDSNSSSSSASDEEILYEQDGGASGGSQNNLNQPGAEKPLKEKLWREDTTDENASQDQSIIEEMTREIYRNLELDNIGASSSGITTSGTHQRQAAANGESGISVQVHVHVHVSKSSSPNRQEQPQQQQQQQQHHHQQQTSQQQYPTSTQEQEQTGQQSASAPKPKPSLNMLAFEHDGAI